MEPIAVNHAERAQQARQRRLAANAERHNRTATMFRQILWIFFFCIDLKATPLMSILLMTPDPITSPRQFIYRYLSYAVGLISFIFAMRRDSRDVWRVFFQNYLIIGFFILEILLSCFGVSPKDSITQLFIYVTTVLLASSARSIFTGEQYLQILVLVCAFMLLGSVVTSLAWKSQGLNEVGTWVGMFSEKNAFGHISAVATGVIFVAGPKYLFNPIVWGATLLVGLLCLAESKCGSGIVMLAAMLGGWMFLRLRSVPLKVSGLFFIAAIGVVFSVYSSEIVHTLLSSLGKDETLSGRTKIWGFAMPLIAEHWLLGAGYDWTASPETVGYFMSAIGLPHLHNAYITAVVNSGVICGPLFFLSYIRAGISAATVRVTPVGETSRLVYWVILIAWFLSGFSEPTILNPSGALAIIGLIAVYGLFNLDRVPNPQLAQRRQPSRAQPA